MREAAPAGSAGMRGKARSTMEEPAGSCATAAVRADPISDLDNCPVCAALESADRRYVDHVLLGRGQTQAQAIADTLGFCALHAAHVSSGWSSSASIARALDAAIRLTLEMLEGRKADSDSTRDFLFESAHACPACTYSARMVSSAAASAAAGPWTRKRGASATALCYPHYRGAAYCVDAAHLPVLAKAELERVDSVKDHMRSLDAAGEESPAMRLIAGAPRPSPAVASRNTQSLRELMDSLSGTIEPPNAREACPVCVAMIRDLDRRVGAARGALRFRSDGWMVLPTCAEHLRLFALLSGEEVAQHAAEQSVVTIARLLRSGIAAVERGRRRREAESKSVWYKPKSPSYLLGLEREVVTRAPPCPVCNGLAAARERAADAIVERVRKRQSAAGLEQGHGLCMKHFAHVFLFTSRGPAREALAAVQRDKLSALRQDLSRSLDRRPREGVSPSGGAAEAVKDAVHRFSGWL